MKAEQFKKLRLRLFRTQAAAAEAMGVTQAMISGWENGKKRVTVRAEKMMKLLERTSRGGE